MLKGVLVCSACQLTFPNSEDQRLHHKSELHRFNLKRKVAGLPAVTKEVFETKIQALQDASQPKKEIHYECTLCDKRYSSKKAYDQHVNSRKHRDIEGDSVPEGQSLVPKEVVVPQKPVPVPEETEDTEDTEENYEKKLDEFLQKKLAVAKKLEITDCLFCRHQSKDLVSNMSHMASEHSLFIPDMDYVNDLEGLVKYLGEKVAIGNFCLFCNKGFTTLEGVQAHMRELAHCRIQYDTDEDEEEYEDFYDYSKALEENRPKRSVTLADNGMELVLDNGKVLGHRSLLVYYKQKYRKPETRDSVLISTLMNQYKALGWVEKGGRYDLQEYKAGAFVHAPAVLAAARQEARRKNGFAMKLGVINNKLQNHYRSQIDF